MYNPCIDCETHERLQCCRSNPETGESKERKILGIHAHVCPYLDQTGFCSVYDSPERPDKCSDYYCPRFNEIDIYSLLFEKRNEPSEPIENGQEGDTYQDFAF